jgi:hypothetical protein
MTEMKMGKLPRAIQHQQEQDQGGEKGMVHAAALLPPGHGQGAGPALLHARHRHPILGLTLAVPRRLDHAHTLRWWVFRFRFKAAPEVPATAASSSRLA